MSGPAADASSAGVLDAADPAPAAYIDAETLDEFLAMTWAAFVDPTGYLTPLAWPVEPRPGVVAELCILGPSPLRITLHVDRDGARDVTRRMRDEADGVDMGAEEVADALGELVNILGGNIKSLLPEGSVLTLPRVGTGAAQPVVATGDIVAVHAWGSCVLTTHIQPCRDSHPSAGPVGEDAGQAAGRSRPV